MYKSEFRLLLVVLFIGVVGLLFSVWKMAGSTGAPSGTKNDKVTLDTATSGWLEQENVRLTDELAACRESYDSDPKMDLTIRDASLAQVLAVFMLAYPGQIVIPAVGIEDRSVTMSLRDVDGDQALAYIPRSQGLVSRRGGENIRYLYLAEPNMSSVWPLAAMMCNLRETHE